MNRLLNHDSKADLTEPVRPETAYQGVVSSPITSNHALNHLKGLFCFMVQELIQANSELV
jgi:hypothetical protein